MSFILQGPLIQIYHVTMATVLNVMQSWEHVPEEGVAS